MQSQVVSGRTNTADAAALEHILALEGQVCVSKDARMRVENQVRLVTEEHDTLAEWKATAQGSLAEAD